MMEANPGVPLDKTGSAGGGGGGVGVGGGASLPLFKIQIPRR